MRGQQPAASLVDGSSSSLLTAGPVLAAWAPAQGLINLGIIATVTAITDFVLGSTYLFLVREPHVSTPLRGCCGTVRHQQDFTLFLAADSPPLQANRNGINLENILGFGPSPGPPGTPQTSTTGVGVGRRQQRRRRGGRRHLLLNE